MAQADGGFAVGVTEGRLKGVKLKAGRGINFPAVDLKLDPLTRKDRRDLDFIALNAEMAPGWPFPFARPLFRACRSYNLSRKRR
jgi:hypothetical protein